MNTDVLSAALDYYNRGFSVIPIKEGEKKPDVGRWRQYQKWRPSEQLLRQWFPPGATKGIGVICGKVSGDLMVRDFDNLPAYDEWAEAHAQLAKSLPTVVTGRGRHVYFRTDPGHHMASRVRKVGKADGELRGQGGYVLAPPSKHPTGRRYGWQVPLGDSLPFVCPLESGLFPTPLQSTHKHTDAIEEGRGSRGENIQIPSFGEEAVEWAIVESLPTGPGERNLSLFRLARNLKAIPHLHDAKGRDLMPILRKWFELALPVIRTKDFATTQADFLHAWNKVQYPTGCGPMAETIERARTLPGPEDAKQFDREDVQFLVALCWQLQQSAGQAPFFLACRTAGELMNTTHTTAATWLRFLVNWGLLVVVEKGGPETMKATRYRYVTDGDGSPF